MRTGAATLTVTTLQQYAPRVSFFVHSMSHHWPIANAVCYDTSQSRALLLMDLSIHRGDMQNFLRNDIAAVPISCSLEGSV